MARCIRPSADLLTVRSRSRGRRKTWWRRRCARGLDRWFEVVCRRAVKGFRFTGRRMWTREATADRERAGAGPSRLHAVGQDPRHVPRYRRAFSGSYLCGAGDYGSPSPRAPPTSLTAEKTKRARLNGARHGCNPIAVCSHSTGSETFVRFSRTKITMFRCYCGCCVVPR